MSIEEAICTYLLSLSPVTALVASRGYMLKLPQKPTLPAFRVQKISGPRGQHLRGPHYPVKSRIQVDAYAAEGGASDPYAGVTTLAEAIRGDGLGTSASGLYGFVGRIVGSPAMFFISNVQLVDDDEPRYEAEELRTVTKRMDFIVHWSPIMH